jgi:hypothetical protein
MSGILIVVTAIAGIASAIPLDAGWSTLGEIEYIGTGITPGVAIDAAGEIHVVYMQGAGIWHRRGTHESRLGPPEHVPSPAGDGNYNSPHLVCDPSGIVHLVFTREFTGRAKTIWYTNRQGGRWRTPVIAIDHATTNRRTNYPRLAVIGTTAYIAAFTGDGSTVVKLADVTTTPRVAATLDTRLWVAHPFTRSDEVVLVGRGGGQGHMLQRHSRDLDPLGPVLLLSRETPKKTGEPTAACIDGRDVIHAAGVTGGAPEVLWYANDAGAAAGTAALLGPVVGDHVDEYTYPVLQADSRGNIFLAYRNHATGEGHLTLVDPVAGQFAPPVIFAPSMTRRLRWNAPLAAAPAGGVMAVWESGGRIYMRTIGLGAEK